MGFPDSEKNITDVLDFLTDACTSFKTVENPNTGENEVVATLDWKKVYYKTEVVNSPYFSKFVKELEDFENMADDCFNHMSKSRAEIMRKQILAYCNSFRYSIDAKSSETLRNAQNTQTALVQSMLKTKIEKSVTLGGELKKGAFSAFLGKDEKDSAYDSA